MINKPVILISIDVEDWFQVENLKKWITVDEWKNYKLRVEGNTKKILDLLDNKNTKQGKTIELKNTNDSSDKKNSNDGVKATFFILGWIAKRVPDLVREIHDRGHEVASHGYSHTLCNRLEPGELEDELKNSKNLLENIINDEVRGYRAPSFSINDNTIELLKKTGYQYDSSFNSFSSHGRYGHLNLNGFNKKGIAYELGHKFSEIPISNLKWLGKIIPWGGGGYFRIIPPVIFNAGIKNILKEQNAFMFYLHPWEIDSGQPRLKEAKGFNAWRHYKNIDKTFVRLLNMIAYFKDCSFLTCSQYLKNLRNKDART